MCVILNEGYIELITCREIALVQYDSRCEFIFIDSVTARVIYKKKAFRYYFRYLMKLSQWERKIKIWGKSNANGKMAKNKCVSYWTRDILSWSLAEKLHWYNITHGVNSSLLIQLGQGVTCSAPRKKGVLRIASVLH